MKSEIEMNARICALLHVLVEAGLVTNERFVELRGIYEDHLEHEADESLKSAIVQHPGIGLMMDLMGTPRPK